jgi:hypothetical protein
VELKFIRIVTNEVEIIEKIKAVGMFGQKSIDVLNENYVCQSFVINDDEVISALLTREVDV